MSKDTKKGKGKVKIPEVRFTLKEPKRKDSTLIRSVFRYDGQKLVYSTKHKIKPSQWYSKTQSPRQSYAYYNELKEDLEIIRALIIETYLANDKLSISEFRQLLDIKLDRLDKEEIKSNRLSFSEFIEDFSDRKRDLGELAENTIKKYKTVKNKLIQFRKKTNHSIDFDDINLGFRDKYLAWLYKETTSQSANTANKDFATIKILLKKAYKEGHHTNLIFEDEDFGVQRVKTSKIAFNEEEVEKLFHYKIKASKKLKDKNITVSFAKKVKDWYLVSCYSSLRWSDFTNIGPNNIVDINGDPFIHTWTQKTNEEVYIPINQNLLLILEEYNYKSPVMSSQRFNEAIKVVCDLAGIRQKVIVNRNVKGKPLPETVRKCDIVSAHDGRRTWASINYSKGFPMLLLMQVTSHKKESTFLSYIGISKKDMAIKLMQQMKAQESKAFVTPKMKVI